MSKAIPMGLVFAVMSALSAGCGAQAPEGAGDAWQTEGESDGEFGRVAQPFSVDSCAQATGDSTQSGGYRLTTPRVYNTCYKGYVADVDDYLGPGYYNVGTIVRWDDTSATTKSACEEQFLKAYLYERTSSETRLIEAPVAYGTWAAAANPRCSGPAVVFSSKMAAGKSYRIAVTARPQDSSSAPTRAVTIRSERLW